MNTIPLCQVAAASVLVLTGCGLQQNSGGGSVREHIVTYRVQSDRPVRVGYKNAAGALGNELLTGIALTPWEKTVALPAGKMAYLTAKLDSELAGTVMTEILVEGRSVKRSESCGEYAIATAARELGLGTRGPHTADRLYVWACWSGTAVPRSPSTPSLNAVRGDKSHAPPRCGAFFLCARRSRSSAR